MNTDPTCRALQHLLVQGFTLYTCPAAVCTRLAAPALLDSLEHAWAVTFDADSQRWVAALPEIDSLSSVFVEASIKAVATPHVVCHTQGETLVLPLEATDVRQARMRIESAVILKLAPPVERLEAYPDELIEREAKRRAARRNGQGDSGENVEQGSPSQINDSEASSIDISP
jgi:hypothetical protein